jgi:hypothetical protein
MCVALYERKKLISPCEKNTHGKRLNKTLISSDVSNMRQEKIT